MSKHHVFFSTLILLISFVSQATEKEFWETKADLQQNMLVSEKTAMDLLKKLEEDFDKSKSTSLMASALFEAKLDYLEFYGSKQDLKSHIEINIYQIAKTHNYYNIYLSKLAILHFELGEFDKYQEVIDKLNHLNGQMYAAVVKLTTKPTESNFQLVNSYCNDCSFFLYDNAIANYYAVLGHYSLLQEFVVNLLASKYKLHEHTSDIKGRVFLAYLYISNKCQNLNNGYLNDIYSDSTLGIENKKGLHSTVKSILSFGCK